jgi:kynureninase
MDWSAWRDEFPIFRRKTYLNTCSLAPLSRRVRLAQERFLDEWEDLGARAWYEHWLDAIDRLRRKFARVIGADAEEIALAPSVSVALSSIASSLDYAERPKVVLSEVDFPTLGHQWAVRPGVERVILPSEDRVITRPEAFENAVDEATAAVATSHVVFVSGAIQDIARIAKAARAKGSLSIIDAYQATGQLPTDVHAAGVDVLITGGLKWLLGGTGIAFLYVRRGLIPRLRPTIAGWFGNARQWEFDARTFEYHTDARRFELGTPANAAVYAASAGIDIVLEIGVERLRVRTNELVADLVDRLVDARFEVKTPPRADQRAGIVVVRTADPGALARALGAEGIIVDYRHDRLRMSPYFYNTPEDAAGLVDHLRGFTR